MPTCISLLQSIASKCMPYLFRLWGKLTVANVNSYLVMLPYPHALHMHSFIHSSPISTAFSLPLSPSPSPSTFPSSHNFPLSFLSPPSPIFLPTYSPLSPSPFFPSSLLPSLRFCSHLSPPSLPTTHTHTWLHSGWDCPSWCSIGSTWG